ncbi:helix-turn-helix domain-containing protein [Croceicoccus mobilis]|uniref:HTH cro/C1-type domain-containing protein n=2 Tax=Croceicoccus mobilis TaxID=1703339 RepID=A0A917DW23_9SPHN|nr:helix-turn-helix transcriptional regulator [Croceicoccus mobilis]GGD74048.1 hypothetical protein GCM10010990_24610 [Croceicoccus mobilis]
MTPRNRVRELRKAKGMSQTELAQAAGISQPAISQIENDTRPITLDWLRTFARILDVTPADILDDDDHPDRLSLEERELIENFRAATAQQREMIHRIAEPIESNTITIDFKKTGGDEPQTKRKIA